MQQRRPHLWASKPRPKNNPVIDIVPFIREKPRRVPALPPLSAFSPSILVVLALETRFYLAFKRVPLPFQSRRCWGFGLPAVQKQARGFPEKSPEENGKGAGDSTAAWHRGLRARWRRRRRRTLGGAFIRGVLQINDTFPSHQSADWIRAVNPGCPVLIPTRALKGCQRSFSSQRNIYILAIIIFTFEHFIQTPLHWGAKRKLLFSQAVIKSLGSWRVFIKGEVNKI